MKKGTELNELLVGVNQKLAENGMLEIVSLNPLDVLPSKLNARYMEVETQLQLSHNVKAAGHLESVPLVYLDEEAGKYRMISGNHRNDAAKAAGLEQTLYLVCKPKSDDEIISKQLAHNALVGSDDQVILNELFQSISDLGLKMATGLNDEVEKISYGSVNFRAGSFKEFTLAFLPEDIEQFDQTMEEIVSDMKSKPSTAVRLASMEHFDEFKKAVIKVKKIENIKSNGVAVMRLVELAGERLRQIQTDHEKDQGENSSADHSV